MKARVRSEQWFKENVFFYENFDECFPYDERIEVTDVRHFYKSMSWYFHKEWLIFEGQEGYNDSDKVIQPTIKKIVDCNDCCSWKPDGCSKQIYSEKVKGCGCKGYEPAVEEKRQYCKNCEKYENGVCSITQIHQKEDQGFVFCNNYKPKQEIPEQEERDSKEVFWRNVLEQKGNFGGCLGCLSDDYCSEKCPYYRKLDNGSQCLVNVFCTDREAMKAQAKIELEKIQLQQNIKTVTIGFKSPIEAMISQYGEWTANAPQPRIYDLPEDNARISMTIDLGKYPGGMFNLYENDSIFTGVTFDVETAKALLAKLKELLEKPEVK